MKKLWGGAFSSEANAMAEDFGRSFESDLTFFEQDVEGSIAHARMLGNCNIITRQESNKLVRGLREILKEGPDALPNNSEDIHTAIEIRLIQKIGSVGGKLHTARSRNDQVATDARLWLRIELAELAASVKNLQQSLLGNAESQLNTVMPGYTHQQPAQPISLGFHQLAYFWMFQRHGFRIEFTSQICNQSPLGSAALAGTSFAIDRHQIAESLGFSAPIPNALDATSDRSFILDALHICALLMIDLSKLAQELILWSSPAFGFVRLDDAFTTGSSIMPQKRNPDMAELIRGRCSQVLANWTQISMVMKGLPLAYNRDLQDDKPALFESLAIVQQSLIIMSEMLVSARWKTQAMAAAAATGFSTATDVADAISATGIPFRQAHEMVGKMVRKDESMGVLTIATVLKFAPTLERAVVADLLNPASAAARRESFGGCGKRASKQQLKRAKQLHRLPGFPAIS